MNNPYYNANLQYLMQLPAYQQSMLRPDGFTHKNSGFYGPIQLPDGSAMTEYSVSENLNGSPFVTHMPSIVPGMGPVELAYTGTTGDILPMSWGRIQDHATARQGQGLSPFYMEGYDVVNRNDYTNRIMAELMMAQQAQ